MSRALEALAALASLAREEPARSFTTAEVARRAGAEVGWWTKPWREALFACMAAGLVETPTRRPHRWRLTPAGHRRAWR